jgi:hypothetical protein
MAELAPCCGGREFILPRCTGWRKERDSAVRQAFSRKRGPQTQRNPLEGENEKLRRQKLRLQEELEKAHIVIDVQKKSGQTVGAPVIPEIPDTEKSS